MRGATRGRDVDMGTPISTLPPEGELVYVTDGGATYPAYYWCGSWRDTPSDGGWRLFSDSATWDVTAPVAAPAVKQAAAPSKDSAALQQAEAALQQAEAAVVAAEATDASAS